MTLPFCATFPITADDTVCWVPSVQCTRVPLPLPFPTGRYLESLAEGGFGFNVNENQFLEKVPSHSRAHWLFHLRWDWWGAEESFRAVTVA